MRGKNLPAGKSAVAVYASLSKSSLPKHKNSGNASKQPGLM
jgi:hypothetical protein